MANAKTIYARRSCAPPSQTNADYRNNYIFLPGRLKVCKVWLLFSGHVRFKGREKRLMPKVKLLAISLGVGGGRTLQRELRFEHHHESFGFVFQPILNGKKWAQSSFFFAAAFSLFLLLLSPLISALSPALTFSSLGCQKTEKSLRSRRRMNGRKRRNCGGPFFRVGGKKGKGGK